MKPFFDLTRSWPPVQDSRSCPRVLVLIATLGLLAGCAPSGTPRPAQSPAKSGSDSAISSAKSGAKQPNQIAASQTPTAKADAVKPAEAVPAAGGWRTLFDSKTPNAWKVTEFGGRGDIAVKDGLLMIQMGAMLTGVRWTNGIPKTNYEVELEGMKVDGSDFFCGLTFPVGDSFCSLILGGWGGGVVGLSSIDGHDASENETTKYMPFEKNRWYRIRLRVTKTSIEAWIDDERIVEQSIEGRTISLRPGEIEYSVPFGVATWQTTGAFRKIRLRPIEPAGAPGQLK